MKLNRRVTGGLAWAGLALIIGVPSAGALFPDRSADKAMVMDAKQAGPSQQAAVAVVPAKATPPAGNTQNTVASVDPVKDFMATGKSLPSYVTSGSSGDATPAAPVMTQPVATQAPVAQTQPAPQQQVAATTPKPVLPPIVPAKPLPATAAVTAKPVPVPATVTIPAQAPTVTELASVEPNKPLVAPVPMPASMRPKPQPQEQNSASIAPFPLAEPDNRAEADNSPVVVLDPVPQPDDPNAPIVTERELAGWKSGTLADYLASEGLLNRSRPRPRATTTYEQNGFYLSDGPNADRYYRDDTYVN
ncbi:MAG TPA: hypothetical protein VGO70_04295 [Arsenicitalea sp.]|jgi:hypothetical protein|nr:hypothetical protein [Arsenicitalea sp.]